MQSLSLAPGVLLAGRYRVEGHIGEGGMGTVWEATHTVTRRSVAMKFLKESLSDRPLFKQRFLREASAASALRHPNVVEVIDVFDLDEHFPVLVMELLRGESLGDKLLRDERLSVEETAELLLPVISAVGTAHQMGIIHRDLKPDNIFLSRSDDATVVKVLDFGIAKLMTPSHLDGSLRTDTGAMLGTPCYMAPEQATGQGDADHRADIWSLGVILYECLSGTRPIEGDNLAQVVTRLMSAGIMPLERLAPELPSQVSAAVMQMLVRDPSRRAPDLLEISKVLRRHARATPPSFGAPASMPRAASDLEQAHLAPAVVQRATAKRNTRAATLASSPAIPSTVTVSGLAPKSRGSWAIVALLISLVLALVWGVTRSPSSSASGDATKAGSPASAPPGVVAASTSVVPPPAPEASSLPSEQTKPAQSSAVRPTKLRPAKPPIPAAQKPAPAPSSPSPASSSRAGATNEGVLFSGRK